MTRASLSRRWKDFCSPFLQRLSQRGQPSGSKKREFASAFWQGTSAPAALRGWPWRSTQPAPCPAPGEGAGWQREAAVTHGWLRSGQNGPATGACPGSRAAAPDSARQHRSNFSPGRGRQRRQAANLRGRGEEGGKEHAGGRKTPYLSKLQPSLATLASLLKHFHCQRNQPIQSSEERSSPGLHWPCGAGAVAPSALQRGPAGPPWQKHPPRQPS